MMDPSSLATPAAVFTAGLVTSVHCSGMCGPLSCALLPRRDSHLQPAVYQASRASAYVMIGGILGAVGRPAASLFNSSPAQVLPWVMVAFFVALGLGLEKKIPFPAVFSSWMLKLRFGGIGQTKMAILLGLATPFLPCAPLYLVFGAALFAGSFFEGAKLMALFAAGTMPLYWLAQTGYAKLQGRLAPGTLQWSRRCLAWIGAALLTWRVTANSGAGLTRHIHCIFCQ